MVHRNRPLFLHGCTYFEPGAVSHPLRWTKGAATGYYLDGPTPSGADRLGGRAQGAADFG